MGNELSCLTSDDLQVQVNQLSKAETEEKAHELLKQETSYDNSYRNLIENDFTGFMEAYVYKTADFKTMTTRARRDLVLFLAKSDLLRDLTFSKFLFSDSKAVYNKKFLVVCYSCLNDHLL